MADATMADFRWTTARMRLRRLLGYKRWGKPKYPNLSTLPRTTRTIRLEGSGDRGETWHPLAEFVTPPEQVRGVIDG